MWRRGERRPVHTTAAGLDFGAGNMGRAAIEMFLRSHECNEHCAHWQEAWAGGMTPTDMRRRRASLRERQHTAGKMAADMARRRAVAVAVAVARRDVRARVARRAASAR